MGLFDKMFGRGATEVQQQQPDAQQMFNQLKQKYQTVLNTIDQQQVQLQNLHVQDNKLYIRGVAPSEQAMNSVWDQVKLVDQSYGDITLDLGVDESRAQNSQSGGSGEQSGGQSYTVQPGDNLSKISRQFYGDSDEYMRIFYANRDKLNDPDMIQVGQQLVIPPDNG